jgi:hypothetical protein
MLAASLHFAGFVANKIIFVVAASPELSVNSTACGKA